MLDAKEQGTETLPPVGREAGSKVAHGVSIKLACELKEEHALVLLPNLYLLVGCFEVQAGPHPHAAGV